MAPTVRTAGFLSQLRALFGGRQAKPAGKRFLESEPDIAFPDRAEPVFDGGATPTWLWSRQRPFRSCVMIAPAVSAASATKATLLDRIGGQSPGLFLIDWPRIAAEGGEWAALWSTSDMRLNRLVMDAFRLARLRGWTIRVIGPIDRGEAPFFQTVEAAAEVVSRAEAEALLERVGAGG